MSYSRPRGGFPIPDSRPELQAISPVDGSILGTFPEASAADVRAAMERARAAFTAWGQTPIRERLRLLGRLRALLVDRLDAHVALLTAATGKPPVEALAGDLLTCASFIQYYEEHAEQQLAP